MNMVLYLRYHLKSLFVWISSELFIFLFCCLEVYSIYLKLLYIYNFYFRLQGVIFRFYMEKLLGIIPVLEKKKKKKIELTKSVVTVARWYDMENYVWQYWIWVMTFLCISDILLQTSKHLYSKQNNIVLELEYKEKTLFTIFALKSSVFLFNWYLDWHGGKKKVILEGQLPTYVEYAFNNTWHMVVKSIQIIRRR